MASAIQEICMIQVSIRKILYMLTEELLNHLLARTAYLGQNVWKNIWLLILQTPNSAENDCNKKLTSAYSKAPYLASEGCSKGSIERWRPVTLLNVPKNGTSGYKLILPLLCVQGSDKVVLVVRRAVFVSYDYSSVAAWKWRLLPWVMTTYHLSIYILKMKFSKYFEYFERR